MLAQKQPLIQRAVSYTHLAALVEEIRNKHAKSQDKLANIEQSIKALG